MLKRHLLWMEKYPNRAKARGIPFTGIDNARPETKAIGERFDDLRGRLPFDSLDYLIDPDPCCRGPETAMSPGLMIRSSHDGRHRL